MSLEKDPHRIEGKPLLILHALGASCPITIMKVEAFALEDECANAILYFCQYGTSKEEKLKAKRTRLVEIAFIALTGIIMGMQDGLGVSQEIIFLSRCYLTFLGDQLKM